MSQLCNQCEAFLIEQRKSVANLRRVLTKLGPMLCKD